LNSYSFDRDQRKGHHRKVLIGTEESRSGVAIVTQTMLHPVKLLGRGSDDELLSLLKKEEMC
jgi:hypothetical protein